MNNNSKTTPAFTALYEVKDRGYLHVLARDNTYDFTLYDSLLDYLGTEIVEVEVLEKIEDKVVCAAEWENAEEKPFVAFFCENDTQSVCEAIMTKHFHFEYARINDDVIVMDFLNFIDLQEKCRVEIWQFAEDVPTEQLKLRFLSLATLEKYGERVKRSNYNLVYSYLTKKPVNLEDIYMKFNLNQPKDFKGHSLSVSDVVVIDDFVTKQAYYCDSISFQSVPEFLKPIASDNK